MSNRHYSNILVEIYYLNMINIYNINVNEGHKANSESMFCGHF